MQSLLVNCKKKLAKNMEWNRNSTEEIDLDKVQYAQNLLVVLQKKSIDLNLLLIRSQSTWDREYMNEYCMG